MAIPKHDQIRVPALSLLGFYPDSLAPSKETLDSDSPKLSNHSHRVDANDSYLSGSTRQEVSVELVRIELFSIRRSEIEAASSHRKFRTRQSSAALCGANLLA